MIDAASQIPLPQDETKLHTPTSIILTYLNQLHYITPTYPSTALLERDLARIIDSWAIADIDRHVPHMITPAAAMAEMSYHHHEYQIKRLIALFTFFMIYIDDRSSRCDPAPFAAFQQNYALQRQQMDPVLDQFAVCLAGMWNYYDPFTANAIVASALEFVNGCYLESITANMELNPSADRYPYFLRSKTGVAQAYTFMIFPKAVHPSPRGFIQAAPSVSYWIDITNDILSFYKEELAHETANYVHLRAAVVRREPIQVVRDLVEEALGASWSIESTLKEDALAAWYTFKVRHAGLPVH
jgi:hypothetical protein